MADRPIIFSGPMVRALLEGRKTQTRRRVKFQDDLADAPFTGDLVNYYGDRRLGMRIDGSTQVQPIPYALGDRLWVRESFSGPYNCDDIPPSKWLPNSYKTPAQRASEASRYIWHWADGSSPYGDWTRPRPSIHMPRWASRLTLIVTDVRVQQLQEISEADAVAEGAGLYVPGHGFITESDLSADPGYSNFLSPRMGFEAIWNSLHGPDAWGANPWVVAISFTILGCNIDQMEPRQ